jgi:hypothetical protein
MVEEFVAAGDFLTFKFPVWQWYVHLSPNSLHVNPLCLPVDTAQLLRVLKVEQSS